MPHKCVGQISHQVHGENKNSEPPAPCRISGESNSRGCACDAYDRHQQNRRSTNPLKRRMRFRIQAPKRIERTAGKQQQPHGQRAHASSEREKECEQLYSNWRFALHQMPFFNLRCLKFSALAANRSARTPHSAFSSFLLSV